MTLGCGEQRSFIGTGRFSVAELDERARRFAWLTFTMHPIELNKNHTIQAQGQLFDGGTYALQLTVIRVDTEGVMLSYAGRVAQHCFFARRLKVPFVADQPVLFGVTNVSQSPATPPLYAMWERSVRVAPGETAVIIIGQLEGGRLDEAEELEELGGLISMSRPMVDLLAPLQLIADSDAPVLVTGETGTGKELLMRAIHSLSQRANSSFVPINCGALPDSLLEAELFGHERGSFTGADTRRVGLLKEADGGTVCLDEVDELTPRGQVALLRVLQDKRFRPIGATREQVTNVRFVAATNASLHDLVCTGRFRADLYYRLCVFSLHLPPLRDRREDILPLAEHFLRKHPTVSDMMPRLTPEARLALVAYAWPGNVRELENVMLRATQLSLNGNIGVEALGIPPAPTGLAKDPIDESFTTLKRRTIEMFEHDYLTRLMRDHCGNISEAARAAGKDRRDLRRLLQKYRISRTSFLAFIAVLGAVC
jgi:DNA-binding NtrC family response regulator